MEVTQIIRDEYGFDSNDDNEFMDNGREYIQGCPDLYLENFQVDFRTKSIYFEKIT